MERLNMVAEEGLKVVHAYQPFAQQLLDNLMQRL
jgi:hypothetical protein